MAVDINALKTEIDTDPIARGYSAMQNAEIVVSLNAAGGASAGVEVKFVTSSDLQQTVDVAEYAALTDVKRAAWRDILTASSTVGLDPRNTVFRAQLQAIWPDAGPTLTRLQALQTKSQGTRAEQLFGDGEKVVLDHVRQAKALP